jgi:hypothetical protein
MWLFMICAWLTVINRAQRSADAAGLDLDDEPAEPPQPAPVPARPSATAGPPTAANVAP